MLTKIKSMIKPLRFLLNSKNQFHTNDHYYENVFEHHNDISYYDTLMTFVKSKIKIDSQCTITLDNKEFNNLTKKDFRKQYGKPEYGVNTNKKIRTEICFYRLVLNGHKVKLELHFYNNSLIFYSYIYSYLSESGKKQIVNLIEKKYLNGQPFDYKTSVIIDDKQSTLHIIESFDFTINCICCIESDLFQNIEKINHLTFLKQE